MESYLASATMDQLRFAHLTERPDSGANSMVDSISEPVILPYRDLTWSLTSDELLKKLKTRPKGVQDDIVVALKRLLQLISPSAQPGPPIDFEWIIRRVPSCTLLHLDLLDRILQYEGGRGTGDVPDGPTPVSQSSCEQNVAAMYSLLELSIPEKIGPIDITNLDECWAGLCATLHLTRQWLIYSKAPQSSNVVAYIVSCGGLWGNTHAWSLKDIREPKESLHRLGIDVYVNVRLACSQDVRPPLRDVALSQVNESMRVIRNNHPDATVLVWAWSAGGYLAACSDPPADIGIFIYPVLSMENDLTDKGTQQRALGPNASDDEKHQASAHACIGRMKHTKLFFGHSIEDQQVPIKATIQYMEAFHGQGGSVAADFDMGGPHGGRINLKNVEDFIVAARSEKWVPQDIDFSALRSAVQAKTPVKFCNHSLS